MVVHTEVHVRRLRHAIGPVALGRFTALLRKRGGAYRGVFTWHGRTTCRGTSVLTAVTVDLHATKAEVADGKWRVTQIEGTMSEVSPQQLGCVASGALYDLAGPLVP
jgi:hypothetical protein